MDHPRFPPHLAVLSGALMGSADAVPGVSGGTIALIVGIYDRFIASLETMIRSPVLLFSRDGRRRVLGALVFLAPLGLGLLAAYYLVSKLLVGATDSPGFLRRPDTAPALYGFFFGLVLFSLREPWRHIRNRSAAHYLLAAVGAALAFVFVGLPYTETESSATLLVLAGAGAIAVMLLPGVSGSLFLVIIGQYQHVLAAVHDRNLVLLAVFCAGLGLGVIGFVPILRALLRFHHDLTMAVLTGLMAGSLRALWPWKDNYDAKTAPMVNEGVGEGVVLVILAAACGAAVVWLLARLERRVLAAEARTKAAEP